MPKVVALKACFIGGEYRKLGDTFEVSDVFVKSHNERLAARKMKGATFKVVTSEGEAKAEASKVKRENEERQAAGARAASGGAAAKGKIDAGRDLVG